MEARLTLVSLGVADLVCWRAFNADGLGRTHSPASTGGSLGIRISP